MGPSQKKDDTSLLTSLRFVSSDRIFNRTALKICGKKYFGFRWQWRQFTVQKEVSLRYWDQGIYCGEISLSGSTISKVTPDHAYYSKLSTMRKPKPRENCPDMVNITYISIQCSNSTHSWYFAVPSEDAELWLHSAEPPPTTSQKIDVHPHRSTIPASYQLIKSNSSHLNSSLPSIIPSSMPARNPSGLGLVLHHQSSLLNQSPSMTNSANIGLSSLSDEITQSWTSQSFSSFNDGGSRHHSMPFNNIQQQQASCSKVNHKKPDPWLDDQNRSTLSQPNGNGYLTATLTESSRFLPDRDLLYFEQLNKMGDTHSPSNEDASEQYNDFIFDSIE